MFNFLKSKTKRLGLEKAKELGLITEEELLRLKSERSDAELKKFLLKGSKKKRK